MRAGSPYRTPPTTRTGLTRRPPHPYSPLWKNLSYIPLSVFLERVEINRCTATLCEHLIEKSQPTTRGLPHWWRMQATRSLDYNPTQTTMQPAGQPAARDEEIDMLRVSLHLYERVCACSQRGRQNTYSPHNVMSYFIDNRYAAH